MLHEERDVDWGIVATEKMISFSLNLPPFNTGIYHWNFFERKLAACNVLEILEYREIADKWEQRLVNHYCDTTSYINVYFNFED